jgi:hypothetical protein
MKAVDTVGYPHPSRSPVGPRSSVPPTRWGTVGSALGDQGVQLPIEATVDFEILKKRLGQNNHQLDFSRPDSLLELGLEHGRGRTLLL